MNIIGFAILGFIAIYILSGAYKGFVWSASTLVASVVSCVLALLLMSGVSKLIVSNDNFYEAMLSYTEGSEYVFDVEYAKTDITKLTNDQIDEVMEKANLPYPMDERVHENIMTEAFKDDQITTLGDYFNESMVMVIVNIISFLIIYFILRVILTFVLSWLDYSKPFPVLRRVDWLVGGCIGAVRGVVAASIVLMVLPIVLTVLPFDAIKELVDASSIATFFYKSSLLLKFIPGV